MLPLVCFLTPRLLPAAFRTFGEKGVAVGHEERAVLILPRRGFEGPIVRGIGDTRYRGPLSKLGGNTSQRTKRAREMERNRPIRDHLPFLETLEHPPESSIPPPPLHPPLPPPLSSPVDRARVRSVRLINLISLFPLPLPRKRGEDSRKIG